MENSLADMIQNEKVGPSEAQTDFSDQPETPVQEESVEVEVTPEPQESIIEESTSNNEIGVVMLSDWFDSNHDNFDRVNRIKAQIRGVDPTERLLCSVLDPKGELDEEDQPIRHLELIKDANVFPVLDIPGDDMDVYGNGFQILYSYNEDIVLKCYGIKTGLIILFCLDHNDQILPYAKTKLKKKDTGLNIIQPNREVLINNISTELDIEGLILQYNQVQKEIDQISDKQSAISWLIARQAGIRDINHLLKIDDLIIWMLS